MANGPFNLPARRHRGQPANGLAGKVVVITGASAGVGRATAREFAKAGARLALVARDAESLERVRSEIGAPGADALMLPLDVADANAVFAAADRVERELGPIDVWINDAMLTVFSPLSQMTPEEFARVTNVTYLGYVYGTMAALHYMRRRNKGTIIQVGSALAYRGIPLQTAYCGAKHAIRGFTNSLRSELLHEGSEIGLTMIQLPAVNTPQFDWARTHLSHKPRPVPPVVQPEAIARVILKAVRKPRREYWLGFSTIKVILASMAVPTFLDHYLARNGYDAQEQKALISPDRRDNLLSPVTNLHRTRGSFGSEAHSNVTAVSGQAVRLTLAAMTAGLLLWTGFAASRYSDRHSR